MNFKVSLVCNVSPRQDSQKSRIARVLLYRETLIPKIVAFRRIENVRFRGKMTKAAAKVSWDGVASN